MAGVMAEIQERLTHGATVQQLIAEGYKAGSVRKVAWQLRKQGLQLVQHEATETDTRTELTESTTDLSEQLAMEKVRGLLRQFEWMRRYLDSLQRRLDCAEMIQNLTRRNWELEAENERLRRFEVWQGHPCIVCGKSTDGVIDRGTASKLLSKAGHRKCLDAAGLRDAIEDMLTEYITGMKPAGNDLLLAWS
jgi:hypothetical protein